MLQKVRKQGISIKERSSLQPFPVLNDIIIIYYMIPFYQIALADTIQMHDPSCMQL